jgi:hypothetical protein
MLPGNEFCCAHLHAVPRMSACGEGLPARQAPLLALAVQRRSGTAAPAGTLCCCATVMRHSDAPHDPIG